MVSSKYLVYFIITHCKVISFNYNAAVWSNVVLLLQVLDGNVYKKFQEFLNCICRYELQSAGAVQEAFTIPALYCTKVCPCVA